MAVVLAKLLLAPACVVAVSLAGRRWGVAVAGILGGLPVVAGPILVVLTLVHGRAFGAEAAAGTLLGLAALTLFVVVCGRTAERVGRIPSLLAGWAAFLLGVGLLQLLDLSVGVSLVFVAGCFAAGLALLPAPTTASAFVTAPPPWWDLPARAIASLALVIAISAASGALGPSLSGLLAPFPIITSVLAVFTYAHGGRAQLRVLLRGFLVGFYGFAAFCFVLAIGLDSLSGAAAFSAALVTALAVQAMVFVLRAIGVSGLVRLCERAVDVVRQTAGIVASPSDLTYDIWTDGACAHKTTGAGGYAAVLVAHRSDGSIAKQWEVDGGDFETTNNRMELMAVIAGLRALPASARVCIHIDSTYVKKNFEERLQRWQGNGWLTADGKPVKNRDLWKELSTEVARRDVKKWVKVPGHTGVPLNDLADQLACAQRDAYAERSRRRPVD